MSTLKNGDKLQTKKGKTLTVKKSLGIGGQGEVYLVDYCGEEKALKWYHSSFLKNLAYDRKGKYCGNEKVFYENILNNINNSAPTSSFLWPEDITKWSGSRDEQYGYVMNVRPSNYNELTDFYMNKVGFKSDRELITACINIIEGFRTLHNNGYSYQDLNNGNFFIDKDTGDVLICDNDNVSVNTVNFGICGKHRYMAPEIVLGGVPDKLSDRFSMAIILFRMICWGHPFEGKYSTPPCMTPEYEKKYYGSDPVFLFDPDDSRNSPVPYLNDAAMKLWHLYPEYIQNLFIKTFNKTGITNGSKRPIDSVWMEAFIRLRGEATKCPKCGRDFYLNPHVSIKCSKCGTELKAPFNLKFGNFEIPIVPGSQIQRYQVDPSTNDCHGIVGKVLKNQTTNAFGIGNVSNETWNVIFEDGTTQSVPQKTIVPIRKGMKILIGNRSGEII